MFRVWSLGEPSGGVWRPLGFHLEVERVWTDEAAGRWAVGSATGSIGPVVDMIGRTPPWALGR